VRAASVAALFTAMTSSEVPAAAGMSNPSISTSTGTTAKPPPDPEEPGDQPDAGSRSRDQDRMPRTAAFPGEHVMDSGYTSADLLLAARARGITLVGLLLANVSPQARAGGYSAEMFTIDWDSQQVTCPPGATGIVWSPCTQARNTSTVVQFAPATCPARDLCTRSATGRQLTLRPREVHEAVTAARAAQDSQHWETGTTSAPAHKAPSARPPTSPASALPARRTSQDPA
jgi:hypothetical protein